MKAGNWKFVSIVLAAGMFTAGLTFADERLLFEEQLVAESLLLASANETGEKLGTEPWSELPTEAADDSGLVEDPEFTMTEDEISDMNSAQADSGQVEEVQVTAFESANGSLLQDREDQAYNPDLIDEQELKVADEVVAYRAEEDRLQREWEAANRGDNGPDIDKAVRVEKGDKFDRYYFANGDEVLRFHKGVNEENLVKALSPILSTEN